MQQQIYFIKKKMIDATLRFRFQRGLHEREREREGKKNKKTSWNPQRKKYWRFTGRSTTKLCNSGSAGSRACVSQEEKQKLQVDCGDFKCVTARRLAQVDLSRCLRVNLVWSRFNFLDGWRARVSGAVWFCLDQLSGLVCTVYTG